MLDSFILVRILDENENNPPYFIENNTNYEIYYRQKVEEKSRKWFCGKLRGDSKKTELPF